MRYLIFEYQYEGHYTEYIRHILSYAKTHLPKDEIFLCVPNKYEDLCNGYLPQSDNFHFLYLSDEDLKILNKKGKFALLTHSYHRCKKISELIRTYNIDQTILITSIMYLCGIALFTPLNASISGIEYIMPRYRENISFTKKLEDKFRMWLYARTPQLKRVFLLNDEESVGFYNEKYSTSKFMFLPDPIDCKVDKNNPKRLNTDKITLLHAGCFRREKGTFDIIDALNLLNPEERKKFRFILCGKSAVPEDNELAKNKIKHLSELMDVEFYNSFVEELFLHKLYQECDYVLMPYHNYFQSSGNLGHAASYHKPVIGPNQGLLGRLIREYSLGYTVRTLDAYGIAETLREILRQPNKEYRFEDYTRRCNPSNFAANIMDTDYSS